MTNTSSPMIGHNQPELDSLNLRCTDIGNAEVFADQHGDNLRYCYELGKWLYWDDTLWKVDSEAHVEELAEQTIQSIFAESTEIYDRDAREGLQKWAIRSGSRQRMRAMVEQARHRLKIDQNRLDGNPMLLNIYGDSVDLTTGEIETANPRDYSTKQTPIIYTPGFEYHNWHLFLRKVMNCSEPLIDYLQKAVGYSLTGKTSEQCFFIAHGSGANGKSVFLNTIRDLAGSYGINIPMATLMAQKFQSANTNDLAMMHGARLGTAMEGEVGQKLSEAKIKQLTGGDEITARHLYKEFFQFKPIVKIWMATNHKPEITGDDPAIWRRVHLIPFDVVIPPKERDGDLPEKLRKELPGILNWAIQGAVKWAQEGLNPPDEVLQATNAYHSEMDTFALFCDETIIKEPDGKTTKKELNSAYELWVSVEGGEDLKPAAINQKMKQLGFEEGRSGQGRFWKDISIADHGRSWDNEEF
jgi:putative DNA primase/helicase